MFHVIGFLDSNFLVQPPSTQKCSHRQFPLLSVLSFPVVGTVSDLWSRLMSNTLEKLCLFPNCYFCLFPRMVRTSAFWMSRGLPRSCSPSTSNTTTSPASYDSLTCVSISCSYVFFLPSSLLLGIDLNFFKQTNWLGRSFIPENLNSGLEFALQKRRATVELGLVFVFCVSALESLWATTVKILFHVLIPKAWVEFTGLQW